MEHIRPNPDDILASIIEEENKSKEGKLKIFFGMCAGVGKTYNMLKAAKEEQSKGIDIVIGLVETHKRRETEDLTEGFEIIPTHKIAYKDTLINEMDLDAIIARKPQIVLVDELAHTNTPGSRHKKRYHDVLEILKNGINVYTTLNVQHLETRAEVVSQITNVLVRETIPDEIFENADEVELIDLPPEELLERLTLGKIYTLDQAAEARKNFFKKGNITALREMALRIVADRVDKQLNEYLHDHKIYGPWRSGLRMLVPIDHHKEAASLLRWAKSLSYSMDSKLCALYVEPPEILSEAKKKRLAANINVAKKLGFALRTITSNDSLKALIDYAQKENITHIVVSKPNLGNFISNIRKKSYVSRLIKASGNIDVYLIGNDQKREKKKILPISKLHFTSTIKQYFTSLSFVVTTSFVCYLLDSIIGYQVVSFILLFLVSILAVFQGSGPILFAASASAIIWDYFFIPPQFTMHIGRPEDILMLIMFFVVALLNGVLTTRVRSQEKKIRNREEKTHALYELTKELSMSIGIDSVIEKATFQIEKNFNFKCQIWIRDNENKLCVSSQNQDFWDFNTNEYSVAEWTFRHSSRAGRHTDTLPLSKYTYFPLIGNNNTVGVIVSNMDLNVIEQDEPFWQAFISQISGKLERELLRDAAKNAFLTSESEKLYKTLFNSISHELRIPVATILGATDTLQANSLDKEIENKLFNEISVASIRLNRLIENLLNMSRLESGRIAPRFDWYDISELVFFVLDSLKSELTAFQLNVDIEKEVPLVRIDYGLMEQVFHNLLINAIQHSPQNSIISINITHTEKDVTVKIADSGKGFCPDEIDNVFEKFFRGKDSGPGGTGLGLSIVKGFIEANNCTIKAYNGEPRGAVFEIRIPIVQNLPI